MKNINSIPKIIHYCWFGRNPLPAMAIRCIKSWRTFLPDYEIWEWNEDGIAPSSKSYADRYMTFNTNIIQYTQEAYSAHKYAFVSDVARMYALYNYGGIYLDTDIEIKKNIKEIVTDGNCILGFEMGGANIMTAFMAFNKGNEITQKMLDYYNSHKFVNSDGSFDITPNAAILTKILKDKGAIMNNKFQCIKQKNANYKKARTIKISTTITNKGNKEIRIFFIKPNLFIKIKTQLPSNAMM